MKFGQKITINHKLVRKETKKTREPIWEKKWVWVSIPATEGIIIGKRTLSNGTIDSNHIYFPKEYFQVLLVAINMEENPVYVKI